MAHEIVMIQQMGDALRNTGYKNIESAVSEILDNAIEAEAKDVFVLVKGSPDPVTGRKGVSEIAFLDNGTGMDLQQLESCLGIGFTTRTDRKGMGRFGVGLPQSSLYACPSVDVYSWRNGYENCHKVYLDINKVRLGEQTQIDDAILCPIPDKFKKFLNYNTDTKHYDFMKSGTFVHWKNCDRVSPKTISYLFPKLEFELGKRFRFLIKDKTHNIRLIDIENETHAFNIMPNDPLFLMKPNYVLGNPYDPENICERYNLNCTEPLFELYTNDNCKDGIVTIPVKYRDKDTREIKESIVTVVFSKVRDIFYDQTAIPGKSPGGTKMGKYVARLEGISIVRAKREIDFGMFNFYKNLNEPQHRWWGCEIRFEPELDEAFGVANNKQHVELIELNPADYADEEVQPMWLQLYPVVHNTISQIYKENEAVQKKSRTVEDITTPASNIINVVEENSETEGVTDKIRHDTPKEELIEKNKEALANQGITDATEDEIISYMKNKVNIFYKDLGRGGPFFDYSFSLGSCHVAINTSHIFYQRFLNQIYDAPDAKTAFELFIAAFVKTIDETVGDQREVSDVIVQEWNTKLRKYINEQYSYGK